MTTERLSPLEFVGIFMLGLSPVLFLRLLCGCLKSVYSLLIIGVLFKMFILNIRSGL